MCALFLPLRIPGQEALSKATRPPRSRPRRSGIYSAFSLLLFSERPRTISTTRTASAGPARTMRLWVASRLGMMAEVDPEGAASRGFTPDSVMSGQRHAPYLEALHRCSFPRAGYSAFREPQVPPPQRRVDGPAYRRCRVGKRADRRDAQNCRSVSGRQAMRRDRPPTERTFWLAPGHPSGARVRAGCVALPTDRLRVRGVAPASLMPGVPGPLVFPAPRAGRADRTRSDIRH